MKKKKTPVNPVQLSSKDQNPVQHSSEDQVPVKLSSEGQNPVQLGSEDQNPVQLSSEGQVPVKLSSEGQVPVQLGSEGQNPVKLSSEGQNPVQLGSKDQVQKWKIRLKAFAKRWFIDAFGGMAQGLFATLIMGLIVKQLGKLIGATTLVGGALVLAGNVATILTGAGIGAGIANALKANKLVIFAAMVAGFVGANANAFINGSLVVSNGLVGVLPAGGSSFLIGNISPGDPIGAYVAAIIATEIGILVTGKTGFDIIVLPFCVIVTAIIVAYTLCPPIIWLMGKIGQGIDTATNAVPFIMGIIIAAVVGILLTLPTSSAAICISIALGGLGGGAAVVGCAAHMVGFAVASFRENKWGGLIAQGLGTSMLQIPNLMKKPIIMLPAIISSIVVGPLATCVFKLRCAPAGSGMGTSGLVGVFSTIEASSGIVNGWVLALGIALLFFILPAIISFVTSEFMRKKGWIKFGDMKLEL